MDAGIKARDDLFTLGLTEKKVKEFGIGHKVGAVSFLQILAPEINDRLLADFLDIESNLIVSMHV